MSGKKNKILIYYVHPAPHKSRINRALIDAVSGIENITVVRLYDEYPDYYIDVKKEQQRLLEHDVIVWQHPFYWYSSPPLLKEWIDLVLEHGFAYGKDGNALQGKKVLNAITTGGSKMAYQEGGRNRFTIRQLLAPFDQTCHLCKMPYLPPFVTHGSLMIDENGIRDAAENYRKIIIALRDQLFTDEELLRYEYINNILD